MARRRRLTRMISRTDTPGSGSNCDEELDSLLVDVLEPTSVSEEEDEERDLLSLRRKIAESVGAPVSVRAKIYLYGSDLLFERSSPDRPLIFGRHESSDLCIPENSVSRRHAELTYTDDAWFVRDLDSRSGTLVNDETATGSVHLKEGDRIQLGNVRLNVSFSRPSGLEGSSHPASPSESQLDNSVDPGETPILGYHIPSRETDSTAPSIQIVRSSKSSSSSVRRALSPSQKSGRVDTEKRKIDIRDRREVENIKMLGLLGAVIIALFVIYAILSAPSPAPQPPKPNTQIQTPEPLPVPEDRQDANGRG